MKCELDKDINKCPFYDKSGWCLNNNPCSFQEKAELKRKNTGYTREPRWYEGYYKK